MNLEMTWGEAPTWNIAVSLPEGTSLEGRKLIFTVRVEGAMIRKTSDPGGGILITNAATGAATLTIAREDTTALENKNYARCPFDLWLDNAPTALVSGFMRIRAAITETL